MKTDFSHRRLFILQIRDNKQISIPDYFFSLTFFIFINYLFLKENIFIGKIGDFPLKGRRESLMENLQPFLLKTFQLDRTKCLKIALRIPRASSNLLSDVSRDEVPQLPSRSCSRAQHIVLPQPPAAPRSQAGSAAGHVPWYDLYSCAAYGTCQITSIAVALAQVNYPPST